mgnify:CR=1 FL=1
MRDDIALEIASELHNLNLNIIELIKTLKENNRNTLSLNKDSVSDIKKD